MVLEVTLEHDISGSAREVNFVSHPVGHVIPSNSEWQLQIGRPPGAVFGALVSFNFIAYGGPVDVRVRTVDHLPIQPSGQTTAWLKTQIPAGAIRLHGEGPWIISVQNHSNETVTVQGQLGVGGI